MGVIEDTGMSDRDKMEMMIEVSGIHRLKLSFRLEDGGFRPFMRH